MIACRGRQQLDLQTAILQHRRCRDCRIWRRLIQVSVNSVSNMEELRKLSEIFLGSFRQAAVIRHAWDFLESPAECQRLCLCLPAREAVGGQQTSTFVCVWAKRTVRCMLRVGTSSEYGQMRDGASDANARLSNSLAHSRAHVVQALLKW